MEDLLDFSEVELSENRARKYHRMRRLLLCVSAALLLLNVVTAFVTMPIRNRISSPAMFEGWSVPLAVSTMLLVTIPSLALGAGLVLALIPVRKYRYIQRWLIVSIFVTLILECVTLRELIIEYFRNG